MSNDDSGVPITGAVVLIRVIDDDDRRVTARDVAGDHAPRLISDTAKRVVVGDNRSAAGELRRHRL